MTKERINVPHLTEIYKMYNEFIKLDIGELFVNDLNVKGTTGHILQLEKLGCGRYKKVLLRTKSGRALECLGPTQCQGGCTYYQ